MTGFPNGLAFHPDGSLIVGLTVEHRLLRFRWDGDQVASPRLGENSTNTSGRSA
jgi:sugar lactone lactonase YvrE